MSERLGVRERTECVRESAWVRGLSVLVRE